MLWSSFSIFTKVICIWSFVQSHPQDLQFRYEPWRILLNYLLKNFRACPHVAQTATDHAFFCEPILAIALTMQPYADGCWSWCWIPTVMPRKNLGNWNESLFLKLLPSWKNADDILPEQKNLRNVWAWRYNTKLFSIISLSSECLLVTSLSHSITLIRSFYYDLCDVLRQQRY